MKKKETVIYELPSWLAVGLINNDESGYSEQEKIDVQTVRDYFSKEYGRSVIIDTDGQEFFGYPDISIPNLSEQCYLRGMLVEFKITYSVFQYYTELYAESFAFKYGFRFQWKYDYLPWQRGGKTFTKSGYGTKIPTTRKVCINNRWYRIYVDIYSNSGVAYVMFMGNKVYIDDHNLNDYAYEE